VKCMEYGVRVGVGVRLSPTNMTMTRIENQESRMIAQDKHMKSQSRNNYTIRADQVMSG
jgi:hypothetical protein